MSDKNNASIYLGKPTKLMSRNAIFNFLDGARDVGKTFGFKMLAIDNYIKKGEEFIYLRRYEEEIKGCGGFFNDIASMYPKYQFKVKGRCAWIRKAGTEKWTKFGYFHQLSLALYYKSQTFPKVTLIGFDEFLIDKQFIRYIADEVTEFLDYYNTIDRYSDRVKVIFMANAVSMANPYYQHFSVPIPFTYEYASFCDGYCAVQHVKSQDHTDHVNETRFGKMIRQTNYYKYAVENKFKDASNIYIDKKPRESKILYNIAYRDKIYGIWWAGQKIYVDKKIGKNSSTIALSRDAHNQDKIETIAYVSDLHRPVLRELVKAWAAGSLYFDSIATRENMIYILEPYGVIK